MEEAGKKWNGLSGDGDGESEMIEDVENCLQRMERDLKVWWSLLINLKMHSISPLEHVATIILFARFLYILVPVYTHSVPKCKHKKPIFFVSNCKQKRQNFNLYNFFKKNHLFQDFFCLFS